MQKAILENLSLRLFRCPQCESDDVNLANQSIVCNSCGTNFSVSDGVIDFRTDKKFDTLLDVEAYDDAHGTHVSNAKNIWSVYENIFDKVGQSDYSNVLEIGSGSGNLSFGLAAYSKFKTVHCSDISPNFMAILQKRISSLELKNKTNCYLFDANNLPFKEGSMSAVVGNSILHHLAFFENTISEAYRVLSPGGTAIFGEPVMDAHVLSSMSAGMILSLSSSLNSNELGEKEIQMLRHLADLPRKKMLHLNSDRNSLKDIEDKFVFPVSYMRNLAQDVGFSKFHILNRFDIDNLGEVIKSFLTKNLLRYGAKADFLDSYEFIFETIEKTVGEGLKKDLVRQFSFFAMVK